MLRRKQDQFSLPPRGRGRIRPRMLDRESVRRILEAHTNLKHRALLEMTHRIRTIINGNVTFTWRDRADGNTRRK